MLHPAASRPEPLVFCPFLFHFGLASSCAVLSGSERYTGSPLCCAVQYSSPPLLSLCFSFRVALPCLTLCCTGLVSSMPFAPCVLVAISKRSACKFPPIHAHFLAAAAAVAWRRLAAAKLYALHFPCLCAATTISIRSHTLGQAFLDRPRCSSSTIDLYSTLQPH